MANPMKKQKNNKGSMIDPKSPKFANHLLSGVLILMLLVALYSVIAGNQKSDDTISLSQVATMVMSGTVKSIDVSGTDLTIKLNDGTEKTSKKEIESSLSDTLKNYGVTPDRIAATAPAIGISTPFFAASSIRTGAVNSPSLSLLRSGCSPRPSFNPSEKFRDCELAQLKTRSPRPDSPIKVSLRAPQARPNRAISEKPRVVRAAKADAPSCRPATMPAAIASTFFAAPPISTPRTSVE